MRFIHYFTGSIHFFLQAALLTLELTAAALAMGTVIGLIFALMKISGRKPLRYIADIYITVIRGTPLIVQLFVIYFGLASVVDFGSFWSAAIALAIHNGAYIAEIFRAGIQSIDRGQAEAARSLGMNYKLTMRRIILPQAFKRIIPPLGNQFIIGLKDSSMAAFVTVPELFGVAMQLASNHFADLQFYSIAGLYYLALVLMFTLLVNWLERRLQVEKIQ
ncbi:amino acid ABC transporter permease [Desulfotomaculum copahuensis]|uniref:Cystine transporter permease n=1 Tax=Desulfotomaculum copahuensis TaxID=1838280 RepID=A0A1B7LAV9_9FIRM|nr:amino acid ABC transporter permease [Desulfotomaculum copahuensis]OAT79351.1 cystine transporter permease [Desulfotomaculum copahuensis]